MEPVDNAARTAEELLLLAGLKADALTLLLGERLLPTPDLRLNPEATSASLSACAVSDRGVLGCEPPSLATTELLSLGGF
jgi:hypothetical protein